MSDSPRDNDTPDDDRSEGAYSDPTAPYPQQYSPHDAGPPPPSALPPSYGIPPAGDDAAGGGPVPPPPSSSQPPSSQPYGTPDPYGTASPYGTPGAYGSPDAGAANPYGAQGAPYGTPPPAYYQSAPPQSNTSALVLTIVSAIGTLSCCLPLPALILGIIALTKQSTEPERSAQLAKYGWITFGAMVALAVLAFIAVIAFGVLAAPTTTTTDF